MQTDKVKENRVKLLFILCTLTYFSCNLHLGFLPPFLRPAMTLLFPSQSNQDTCVLIPSFNTDFYLLSSSHSLSFNCELAEV